MRKVIKGKRKKLNGKSFNQCSDKQFFNDYSANKLSGILPFKRINLFTFYFLLFTFMILPVFAQEQIDDRPDDLVPPPLNIVSKEEREKLDGEQKMKSRTKLAIELMEARILKSEELLKENNYQESLDQIGVFQGILIDTMKFLKFNENDKGVYKNYKRLEMNLRDFMPRLELIRREMPYRYGYHLKTMLKFVRDARTKALNPLFDDTVIPEGNL